MTLTALEQSILDRITPSETDIQSANALVDKLSAIAISRSKELGTPIETLLVGSLAKGTFLVGVDVDLFLLFPPDTSREELEKCGLDIGHILVPDGEERYAEHPYVHGWVDGFEVDIVPCYKLESTSDMMSAVDRTPFHTHYIKEHLSDEMKQEVLLLKRFMKGTGVYGAEASVGGFSGYLCELLVLACNGFRGVLAAAHKWERGEVLTLAEPPAKKFPETLVFVDPVDNKRNVAAALTKQTLAVFQHAAEEYLSNPNELFFFPNDPDETSVDEARQLFQDRATTPLLVSAARPDLVDDVFYPQFLKMYRTLQERCTDEGFPVVGSAWRVEKDSFHILLELETSERSNVIKHSGPPVNNENASRFLDKWQDNAVNGPYLEEGKWVAEIRRDLVSAQDVVFKGLLSWAIGKDMHAMAEQDAFTVLISEEAIDASPSLLLTSLLKKRFNWQW